MNNILKRSKLAKPTLSEQVLASPFLSPFHTRKFLILGAVLVAAAKLWAGTLTGSIQTASGGTVNRGTLTFNLSQPGVVSSTASIVTSQFSCYTSAQGNVVAVPDPGNPVALSSRATSTASPSIPTTFLIPSSTTARCPNHGPRARGA
jgi:hypothetical protein